MIYALIFVLLFTIEVLYFRIASRLNIIDKPNLRSSHSDITLRGGGIIFYFGVVLYSLFFNLEYPWFLLSLSLITIISFIDDVYTISSRLRLFVQFIAIGIMLYQVGIYDISWWYSVIALVFCAGVMNAYNFMDGINGITGGYSVVVLAGLAYININTIEFVDIPLIWVTLISLLVFLFFNFRAKAKCFAGDVGAISISFIIVFLLSRLVLTTGDFSYIILIVVYGVDTVLTIAHRLMLRENVLEAHRKHAYQLMANELKIGHLKTSLIYITIQALVTIGYFAIQSEYHYCYFISVLLVLSTIYVIFIKKYIHLHK